MTPIAERLKALEGSMRWADGLTDPPITADLSAIRAEVERLAGEMRARNPRSMYPHHVAEEWADALAEAGTDSPWRRNHET
jgi:hypothetical protein